MQSIKLAPISSNAPRPLGAAYIPILLSEVEQEQRPSGNGDREAIVVGAGPCDGEGERAYTRYAPHIIRNVPANVFSLKRFGIFFCRNVRRHVFAETSGIHLIVVSVVSVNEYYNNFASILPGVEFFVDISV